MKEIDRRQLLRSIGAGTAVSIGGLGAATGTAAAWDRRDVVFNGCSEAWVIVGEDDIAHDPPAVVMLVVATPDDETECRGIELTEANTTTIPDQFGDTPVRTITAGDGETILGVIFYNYDEGLFSSPSCIHANENDCVMVPPDTPRLEEAPCVEAARDNGAYDCTSTVESGNQSTEQPDQDSGNQSSEVPDQDSDNQSTEQPDPESNSQSTEQAARVSGPQSFDEWTLLESDMAAFIRGLL